MKKSFLNTAVTAALSCAMFSGSVLFTQVYANDLTADNNTSNDTATETYLYQGMGVGAASGALVAGPVGLLVGGLIGAITGSNQRVSEKTESISTVAENPVEEPLISGIAQNDQKKQNTESDVAEQISPQHSIQVAQLGTINTAIKSPLVSQQDALLEILTSDLNLDIYFRSGSTSIESFYPARLAAIADLMNTMDQLELHLDGYTDRRGDKTKNIALANQRIKNVREQLIDAGVDENRIISKAFGEMKMVSSAGDLEAYTFDRKVVIRFERSAADSTSAMTTALSDSKTKSTDAVVADTSIEF